MAQETLSARIRETKGKGAARKIRKENQLPAIFYSPGRETVMLNVNTVELQTIVREATSENIILNLHIDRGNGGETKTVLLKELQVDPINGSYYHADFFEISMDKELTVDISINFLGTPVGVTNGGILQHVRREIAVSCLPDKIIEKLDIDVSHLEIGESVHIEDIQFPEGIKTSLEGHLTVATVSAPTVTEPEPEEEEFVEELEEGEERPEGEETEPPSE
jgi:large subunit ribosomal protein L25